MRRSTPARGRGSIRPRRHAACPRSPRRADPPPFRFFREADTPIQHRVTGAVARLIHDRAGIVPACGEPTMRLTLLAALLSTVLMPVAADAQRHDRGDPETRTSGGEGKSGSVRGD